MEYIAKVKSEIGKRNQSRGTANQDRADIFDTGSRIVAVVSDGASKAENGAAAAMINNKAAKYIAGIPELFSISEKELKAILSNEYMRRFERSGYNITKLCATTAFVIADKESGRYCAFTMGDSGILSFDANMNTKEFIAPVNFFKKSVTCFTNDSRGIKRFSSVRRGVFGRAESGFILYTDGAGYIAEDQGSGMPAEKLAESLYNGVYDEQEKSIFDTVKERTIDDISIVSIALKEIPGE